MAEVFKLSEETGKAILYHRASGAAAEFWPVDAREILKHNDEYSTNPVKSQAVEPVSVETNIFIPTIDVPVELPPVVEKPDLSKMKKVELLNYSKKIGLDLSITLVTDQLVEAIQTRWEELDE